MAHGKLCSRKRDQNHRQNTDTSAAGKENVNHLLHPALSQSTKMPFTMSTATGTQSSPSVMSTTLQEDCLLYQTARHAQGFLKAIILSVN